MREKTGGRAIAAAKIVGVISLLAIAISVLVLLKPGILPDRHRGYRLGDDLGLDSALFSGTEKTVVLFASSSCVACQTSAPALKALLPQLRDIRTVRTVFVTFQGNRDAAIEFASDVGFDPADVFPLSRDDYDKTRLNLIPSIVTVDKGGKVVFVHHGPITETVGASVIDGLVRSAVQRH